MSARLTFPVVEQLRPNFTRLHFGALVVWYSYKTPIAFKFDGMPRVVRENDWGPTTGKHLTEIDGGNTVAKKERVDGETFKVRWAMMADMIQEKGINLLVD